MADKNGKLTAWEIVNGNLLAMKMKDQVYIEVCDWELETIRTELQKYAKYKRAFEILKKYNNVKFDFIDKKIIYYLDQENQAHVISKEEYELLEGLMKDE